MTGLDLEAVLNGHQGKIHFDAVACWPCGERFESWPAHRAHVAAVLRVEIESALADAWDEAVNAVAWALNNGPADSALPYVGKTNPYRATLTADEGEV